ncbi:hypothetical protein T06_12096 [Trichinella sp. T6]|nr:hypothetical protein T06_12096 [Trichinella sp. T6]
MDFDTVFRETRSGRNVRQIIVLPDLDVSEPDTVSEDELDCTFHNPTVQVMIKYLKKTMHPPMREENHTSNVDDRSTLKQKLSDNDKAVMDQSHPDYDIFYKIRPLIESVRKTCLEETPGELQSVDEHIIPYKGR